MHGYDMHGYIRPRWIPIAFLAALASAAPVAEFIPAFEGETLSGKHLIMPQAARGHVSLLIFGFTQASSRQTGEWAQRTRQLSDGHLCDIWSIAVLEDVPRLLRGIVVRGIKSGIPKDRQESFLIVFNHERELKQAVSFQQPDDAWLVLLDVAGVVKWRYHGAFSTEAFTALRKQIE